MVRAACSLAIVLAACASPGDAIGPPVADASGGEDSGGIADPEGPLGWASVAGQGQAGTNGGAGGEVVQVGDADALALALARPEPLIVRISGTLTGSFTLATSDKTIEGLPGAALHGTLDILGTAETPVRNVIVRNLIIRGDNCSDGCSDLDAVSLRWAHHVWIDHCDIGDGDDGNLDITRETDYVTVSWSKFSYSNADRPDRYSNVIGGADEDVDDADDLKVTLHHNWWSTNVLGHMPRVRFGMIHLFDNYYDAVDNEHCVRIGLDADVRIENNSFADVTLPIDDPIDPSARVRVHGNLVVPDALADAEIGTAFVPPYPYSLDPPEILAAIVPAGAGPP